MAVTKLGRLARSVKHLCDLAAELVALGVHLVVLDQAIDTSTPWPRVRAGLLSGLGGARFERRRGLQAGGAPVRPAQE